MNNQATRLSGHSRILYLGPFLSMFDRFSIAPLLLPIAHDLRVTVAQVTVVATAYFLLYGAMQVVYGLISDRIGRVLLLRLTCVGAALAGLVSAFAPNLPVLIAGRALTGCVICAIIPTSVVYVADSFPFEVRQRAIADLLAAVGLGTAAATFSAGLLAHYLSWRVAFLLPALAALGLAYALRWLPETLSRQPTRESAIRQLAGLARRPWLVFLTLFAVPEGAAMLGFFTFLAPTLEAHGQNPAVAGIVTGFYGIAVLAGTQVVKRIAPVVGAHWLIVSGGAALTLCYAVAALSPTVPGILGASFLAGTGYAVMHSTFQTWATEVAPQARGIGTALFVSAVFLGGGLATAGVGGLAGAGNYALLFWWGVAVTAPTVAVGAVARRRFRGQPADSDGVTATA
ncbi:MAG: MFS transporter [Candidatus Dormibacter sp.]|uniref:MFS transporter n=1 Tax=Candidatus Dormibacter sp. TaxID=2973982 RepID=UPI000DB51057|nr:MAG: MFS transporter [Candidatus Dormibacteraeota bacterium]